ncbi:MAG: glycosyltransferase [Clostridia bacterium]|nr:glycosyltransferase [Clostridia bacterium]
MRVLQINAVYGFGSTGLIAQDISKMLVDSGNESFVAYQKANVIPENSYKVGNNLDWKYHAVHTRVFGKQGYASRGETKKLLKWIDKIKPDVVHFHNLHSNYINLNMLCDYLNQKNIPAVITMHDCWYFTGKCSHYVEAKCNRWQVSCGQCPLLKTEVPSLFFDNTSKVLFDRTSNLKKIPNLTLVGCSEWIANEAKKSLLKDANIEVVRNGVDTSIFTPHESDFRKEHNIKNSEFVILGMANKWGSVANRSTVEKIINSSDENTKIVIVGCNEETKAYFDSFENVVTVGFVKDRQLLSDIYASADVFVNLTHADTLPTVNMESICCGTPVITFNCTGSPELIDKDSGYVVNEDDAEGIIEKIESIKNEPLKFDVAEKQHKFDKNLSYRRYLDIYSTVKLTW